MTFYYQLRCNALFFVSDITQCVYLNKAEGSKRGKKSKCNRGYNVFNVIMVIRHAKDGKMYLYDIMNIKKETSTLFQSEDITQ